MKLVNALLGALITFCTVFAQNQTLDSIAVSTKYLDEVVVASYFALKRSQSGKTVIKNQTGRNSTIFRIGIGYSLVDPFGNRCDR